ncbi:MAG: hypothetical protein ACSHYA_16000 [Opitutaceae bacterium]
MNKIETDLLHGNQARDLESLVEGNNDLRIWLLPYGNLDAVEQRKGYLFRRYKRKYLELQLEPNEALEPYLPFIGGESNHDSNNDRHYFSLNFADFEIGFWSDWPESIDNLPVAGIHFIQTNSTTSS